MNKNQFCAVLAFGFLLGMFATDCWWLVQMGGNTAGLLPACEPASTGESPPGDVLVTRQITSSSNCR